MNTDEIKQAKQFIKEQKHKRKENKMTKNQLVPKKKIVDTLKQLDEEIQQEYLEAIKQKAKQLRKEIRMAEIVVEKKKERLAKMLKGEATITEEELLFND